MVKIEPEEPAFDPADWRAGDDERFLEEGIRLFEAREYHAAHESFEKVWLSTQGEESDFFKGLVQASMAMHHFSRGNLEGASKLYSGHRRLLAGYMPTHRGVDVATFLTEMQRVLRPVVRAPRGTEVAFDPADAPRMARTQ